MGEQENPCALDFCKRGRITSAEVLQIRLLLWRECNRILRPRSWHKDSPPNQGQVGRIVIGQDLAHVKPATYVLRAVLSALQSRLASAARSLCLMWDADWRSRWDL